jgi:hypothetical protein
MSNIPIKIEVQSSGGASQPLGRPIDLSVQVTNVSDQPVWVVGVLPGSDGIRYPQYQVEIEGPSGPVDVRLPEAADYVPALRPKDFVRLDPGESFDPQQGQGFIPIQQLSRFKPTRPGKYRLRIRLDTTAENPRQWMGHTVASDQRLVESLIKQVPKVQVRSNTLEIELR